MKRGLLILFFLVVLSTSALALEEFKEDSCSDGFDDGGLDCTWHFNVYVSLCSEGSTSPLCEQLAEVTLGGCVTDSEEPPIDCRDWGCRQETGPEGATCCYDVGDCGLGESCNTETYQCESSATEEMDPAICFNGLDDEGESCEVYLDQWLESGCTSSSPEPECVNLAGTIGSCLVNGAALDCQDLACVGAVSESGAACCYVDEQCGEGERCGIGLYQCEPALEDICIGTFDCDNPLCDGFSPEGSGWMCQEGRAVETACSDGRNNDDDLISAFPVVEGTDCLDSDCQEHPACNLIGVESSTLEEVSCPDGGYARGISYSVAGSSNQNSVQGIRLICDTGMSERLGKFGTRDLLCPEGKLLTGIVGNATRRGGITHPSRLQLICDGSVYDPGFVAGNGIIEELGSGTLTCTIGQAVQSISGYLSSNRLTGLSDLSCSLRPLCTSNVECGNGNACINYECREVACGDGLDNDLNNQTDCSDTQCLGTRCSANGFCSSEGLCLELDAGPTPSIERVSRIELFSYERMFERLHEGEVIRGSGSCDAQCASVGKICGFAQAGRNTCSDETSTKCTCY